MPLTWTQRWLLRREARYMAGFATAFPGGGHRLDLDLHAQRYMARCDYQRATNEDMVSLPFPTIASVRDDASQPDE